MPFREDAWPKGEVATYSFDWSSVASASMRNATGEMGTRMVLRGDLALRSYGMRQGALLLGLRLPRIEEAQGDALGHPVSTPDDFRAELASAEVAVLLEPDGFIRELSYSESSTPVARSALRALAVELAAVVCSATGRREVVDTSLGRARVGQLDGGATSRVDYEMLDVFGGEIDDIPELTSRSVVSFDDRRRVAGLVSNEALSAVADDAPLGSFRATTSLTATLRSRERGAPEEPPRFAPGSVRAATGIGSIDRRASLERRSQGVTRESVVADVVRVASLPHPPSAEWVWRDSAFLELHPEESRFVVDAGMADRSLGVRATTFDIVVIAGTEAGQAALVDALGRVDVASDHFEVLVQRLGHLAHPTTATVKFVEGAYARASTTSSKRSCAYVLGALARHSEDDAPETTKRLVGQLERELTDATTDESRETLIGALGNAGQPSSALAITKHAQRESEDIRYSVASALRRMDSRPAIDVLKEMLTDAQPRIATAAAYGLGRMRLEANDWDGIAATVRAGKVADGAHPTLLDLAANKLEEDPGAIRLLVAMIASENVSLEHKERVSSLLRQ